MRCAFPSRTSKPRLRSKPATGANRGAVSAGRVPLFEDLGGGRAQLVHLSYQEVTGASGAVGASEASLLFRAF